MDWAALMLPKFRKGFSPDISTCEGFLIKIKNEKLAKRSWIGVSIDEFIAQLKLYLQWHNEKRLKLSFLG